MKIHLESVVYRVSFDELESKELNDLFGHIENEIGDDSYLELSLKTNSIYVTFESINQKSVDKLMKKFSRMVSDFSYLKKNSNKPLLIVIPRHF